MEEEEEEEERDDDVATSGKRMTKFLMISFIISWLSL